MKRGKISVLEHNLCHCVSGCTWGYTYHLLGTSDLKYYAGLPCWKQRNNRVTLRSNASKSLECDLGRVQTFKKFKDNYQHVLEMRFQQY